MQFSEQKFLDAGSLQNAIGAEVRGKVDGAFDSGYLMTATVNGKLFRGVLFAPGLGPIPRGPILAQNPHMALAQPLPNHSNHLEPRVRLFQQPMKSSSLGPGQSFPHQVARPFPVFRASSSNMPKEPSLRSDLQGVVLTLGGPGSSQH
ncbi:uncharacterized protein LOC112092136 [Morus notabilis]|nr:uncharacterized protein LOC112092136 [Morus notabilis]